MRRASIFGLTFIFVGVVVGGIVLYRLIFSSADREYVTPPAPVATSTANVGVITSTPETIPETRFPVRLSVPSAEVNAAVQYVGAKADGSMANPSNFTDVAWYKRGTVPGEVGSAVIAGHVDNALALSGVFKNLKNTEVGDEVYVTRKDGVKLRFVVDRVEYYPYKEAPNIEIFTSSDGKAHLNLVTCAGTWLKTERSYSERLVVYSTLAE